MGQQTLRAILDPAFKHGKISATVFPIDEIERAITMLAIERLRIGSWMAGKIRTIQILTIDIVSQTPFNGMFHIIVSSLPNKAGFFLQRQHPDSTRNSPKISMISPYFPETSICLT